MIGSANVVTAASSETTSTTTPTRLEVVSAPMPSPSSASCRTFSSRQPKARATELHPGQTPLPSSSPSRILKEEVGVELLANGEQKHQKDRDDDEPAAPLE